MSKFGAQMDAAVLARLRKHAVQSGRTIGSVLTEAVREYLEREQVRPAFVSAAQRVLDEHTELLERLAK